MFYRTSGGTGDLLVCRIFGESYRSPPRVKRAAHACKSGDILSGFTVSVCILQWAVLPYVCSCTESPFRSSSSGLTLSRSFAELPVCSYCSVPRVFPFMVARGIGWEKQEGCGRCGVFTLGLIDGSLFFDLFVACSRDRTRGGSLNFNLVADPSYKLQKMEGVRVHLCLSVRWDQFAHYHLSAGVHPKI